MSNKNASVRFTLNFANKTIVGTKASFNDAGKGYGPVYDELVALMAKHPSFGVEIKTPRQPANKQTYKGMDIPFMRDYLLGMGDNITLKTMDDVIAFAEKDGGSKYPLAKRVLFDAYEDFDYVEAKRVVDDYRFQQLLDKAVVLEEVA